MIVIEINRYDVYSVSVRLCLCVMRDGRGEAYRKMDEHDSSRHTVSDKETQRLSWTLRKQLVRCMLNITAHLLQHLKSVPCSVPQK